MIKLNFGRWVRRANAGFQLGVLLGLLATWGLQAQPDNDLFSQRQRLAGSSLTFGAYLLDATLEAGEPALPFTPATRSAWFTWTAPAAGFARVRVVSWQGEPVTAAVYTGSTLGALELVGPMNQGSTGYFEVTAAQEYQIAAYTHQIPGVTGYAEAGLDLDFVRPPTNDGFANRLPLNGSDVTATGSNAGATRELDEPGVDSDLPNHTVWWQWTAPATGTAIVTVRDQEFGVRADAFTGTTFDQLALVGSNATGFSLPLNFATQAGQTYHLRLSSLVTNQVGQLTFDLVLSAWRLTAPASGAHLLAPAQVTFRWTNAPTDAHLRNIQALSQDGILGWWSELNPDGLTLENLRAGAYSVRLTALDDRNRSYVTPPVNFLVAVVNDHFADRLPLSGSSVTATGVLRGATVEPFEPTLEPSVWWTWVPPFSGRAVINLQPGARFGFYTGNSLTSLQPITPVVEAINRIEFDVPGGGPIQIRVSAQHEWADPSFQLQLLAPPENDAFAGRLAITTPHVNLTLPIGLAGVDPSEPASLVGPDQATVWFTWTAPASGWLGFGGGASDGYYGYAIFTGETVATLQPVVGPSYGVAGTLFDPEPGRTYQIAVIGHRSNPGTLSFIMDFIAAPANDLFAHAQPLSGPEGQVAGNNEAATTEPGEPQHHWQQYERSVWYAWTAPRSGLLELFATPASAAGLLFEPAVAVYRGPSLTSLTALGSELATTNHPVYADVEAGTTYHLAVAGMAFSASSDFQLSWRLHDRPSHDAFAERIPLTGMHLAFAGVNFGATREPGEPAHGGAAAGRSVWWTWTAPHAGWVTLSALGADSFAARLLAYQGTSLDDLDLVGDSTVLFPGIDLSATLFEVKAGETYQLALDTSLDPGGSGSRPGGHFEVELDLSTLRLLAPTNGAVYGGSNSIVLEVNTPLAAVDGELAWVDFHTFGGAGSLLGESLGLATQAPFRVVVTNLPPARYLLLALATNTAGDLRVSLPVIIAVAPANDDFAARIGFTGRSNIVWGTTAGAGREAGEPRHSTLTNAPTVWYSWTAPADGPAVFSLGEMFGTVQVYRGDTLAQLVAVTNDPPMGAVTVTRGERYELAVEAADAMALAPGYTNRFALQVRLETVQLIQPNWSQHVVSGSPVVLEATTTERSSDLSELEFLVNGTRVGRASSAPYQFTWISSAPGDYRLGVRAHFASGEFGEEVYVSIRVTPPNDDFAARALIADGHTVFRGNTVGATVEAQETSLASSTLWFAWRAPSSGLLTLDGAASSYWPQLTVFRGSALGSLTQLASDADFPTPGPLQVRVEAGVDYAFAVGDRAGQVGAIEYRLGLELPPANDNFAQRVALSGQTGDIQTALHLTTVEPGEPSHAGIPAQHSAWWTWTAPASGALRLTTEPLPPTPLNFGAYLGDTLASLVALPVYRHPPELDLDVVAGTAYQFAFEDSFGTLTNVPWHFEIRPAPPNDAFAQRTPLTGRWVTAVGTVLGATREPDEPRHHNLTGVGSAWWSWTAPASGHVRLMINRFGFETTVGVYQGATLKQLTPQASGWDRVEFEAVAGVSYAIALERNAPGGGEVQLQLTLDYPPPNDAFAHRTTLQGSTVNVSGWNTQSSRELSEPFHAGHYGGRSVWYAWQAPDWGWVTVDLNSTFWTSLVGVYRGTNVADLLPVHAGLGGVLPTPTGYQGTNQLQFEVRRGVDYVLAVDGQMGVTGEFSLHLNFTPTPAPFELSLESTAPGQWRLNLLGLAGRSAELQSSTNLTHWTPVISTPSGGDTYQHDLETPLGEPEKFFRAVLPTR
jgi:hypothetical protein